MTELFTEDHRAFQLGWTLIKSVQIAGDGVQAPGAITMCRTDGFLPIVVHFFNAQDGGFHSGDYFKTQKDAEEAYTKRVLRFK